MVPPHQEATHQDLIEEISLKQRPILKVALQNPEFTALTDQNLLKELPDLLALPPEWVVKMAEVKPQDLQDHLPEWVVKIGVIRKIVHQEADQNLLALLGQKEIVHLEEAQGLRVAMIVVDLLDHLAVVMIQAQAEVAVTWDLLQEDLRDRQEAAAVDLAVADQEEVAKNLL